MPRPPQLSVIKESLGQPVKLLLEVAWTFKQTKTQNVPSTPGFMVIPTKKHRRNVTESFYERREANLKTHRWENFRYNKG